MEQETHITLRHNLAIGNVTLNESVYRLRKLGDALMIRVVKQVLQTYDDLITQRLSRSDVDPSKDRKGGWDVMEEKMIPMRNGLSL